MSDDAVRQAILARRARFLAAALAATLPGGACAKPARDIEPDKAADGAPRSAGDDVEAPPQVCLKVDGTADAGSKHPADAEAPRVCLSIAIPPDGGVPAVCLSMVAPTDGGTGPTIKALDFTTTGGADVQAVIQKNRWRLRACYQKALAIDPGAGGSVTVTVTTDADGKTTRASAKGGTPEMLGPCFVAAFYSMAFTGAATFDVKIAASSTL